MIIYYSFIYFKITLNFSRGNIKLHNANIDPTKADFLYHLGIAHNGTNLQERFGDVKIIITAGSAGRMKYIAERLRDELQYDCPLDDISASAGRYSMYKIGPVICVNHGMGSPSLSILLHELFKLLYYAKATNVTIIRMGTCGCLGKYVYIQHILINKIMY